MYFLNRSFSVRIYYGKILIFSEGNLEDNQYPSCFDFAMSQFRSL